MMMMLFVVFGLNVSIVWTETLSVEFSVVLIIVLLLSWDILHKMMSRIRLLLASGVVRVMRIHLFPVLSIILFGSSVRSLSRMNLAKSTMSIEVSHFTGDLMMLWKGRSLLHVLLGLSLLITHNLF